MDSAQLSWRIQRARIGNQLGKQRVVGNAYHAARRALSSVLIVALFVEQAISYVRKRSSISLSNTPPNRQ